MTTRAERARRAARMAWIKSNDWFPDDCTPPQRHRYTAKTAAASSRKPHSAKALPGGELIAVLPRVGDRFGLAIKFADSGRVCASPFTYQSHYAALRAAFDFWTPAENELSRTWRDEFGQLPLRQQPRLKPTSITKESTP
jgi:hypothetical protein